jgi:cell division protein FtsB
LLAALGLLLWFVSQKILSLKKHILEAEADYLKKENEQLKAEIERLTSRQYLVDLDMVSGLPEEDMLYVTKSWKQH